MVTKILTVFLGWIAIPILWEDKKWTKHPATRKCFRLSCSTNYLSQFNINSRYICTYNPIRRLSTRHVSHPFIDNSFDIPSVRRTTNFSQKNEIKRNRPVSGLSAVVADHFVQVSVGFHHHYFVFALLCNIFVSQISPVVNNVIRLIQILSVDVVQVIIIVWYCTIYS